MKKVIDSKSKAAEAESQRGSTSHSLLYQLKQNHPPAWRDLVHLYSPLIHYWARRAGLPEKDCADVVQEVFRSVFTGIKTFRKDSSCDTFRGWLRTITRNKVTDHFRRVDGVAEAVGGTEAKLRLAENVGLDDNLEGDEQAMIVEYEVLMRAIDLIRKDFKELTWKAFWGMVVEGKTATEVAAELQTRPGNVRVSKSRVLKRLREQLAEKW